VGTKSNRDAIGARVTLKAGGLTMIREVNGGNGYSGQSSLRLHFGIGRATKVDSAEIRWPSGAVQKETLETDRITRITER
jgi:enediyne biosynthesis protein E4